VTQPAQADPFEMWRNWLTESERQWNSFLNQAMSTDEFSQSMGRFMDVYLNMQKNMNEAMGRALSAINVPTRTDILTLGDRLSGIEDTLSEIQASLRQVAASSTTGKAAAATAAEAARPRPTRTKKPAKA